MVVAKWTMIYHDVSMKGSGKVHLHTPFSQAQNSLKHKLNHPFDSTSSPAQGGSGSFKNRKPIGEIGCCESGMAKRIHWWTERCLRSPLFLSLSLPFSDYLPIYLSTYLPIYLSIFYLPIYLSIDLSIYLSLSLSSNYLSVGLSIYLSTYLSIYPSICLSLSLSFICQSVYLSSCLSVYLSIYLSVCLSTCLSVVQCHSV